MIRRRRIAEESDNHERWLVSYADFITLLFAFFVVMYSLSSVNEGKYRVLSDSLVSAFRNININESGQQIVLPPTVISAYRPHPPTPARPYEETTAEARKEQLRQVLSMADSIRRVLEPLTRSGQVSISEGAHGITVEINASALFPAGGATLDNGATAPLRAVADVLAGGSFPVTVEGHTDDIPINTFRFPSNWELSSARASSVVRLFVESGVAAERLTAAGYSDQRPIAVNDSAESRARNRRVTIRIDVMYADPPPVAPGRIRPDDPIRAILPGGAASAETISPAAPA